MSNRYRVGNTDQTRHLVVDTQGASPWMAACVTPEQAARIVDALNMVEEAPPRFMVTGPGAQDQVPVPPAECVDVATRRYLTELFGFLRDLAEDGCNPDDVPSPPWLP